MTDFFMDDSRDISSIAESLKQNSIGEDNDALIGSAVVPASPREQAENKRQQWQDLALENMARREESWVRTRALEEIMGTKQRHTFYHNAHLLKFLISKYKFGTTEPSQSSKIVSNSTGREDIGLSRSLIELVRSGLQSSLHGKRLGASYESDSIDAGSFSDDDIEEFIRVKLGLIFAALSQRYRFQGHSFVVVGDKNGFCSDVKFMIDTRMPVAGSVTERFVDLLYKQIRSNPSSIPLSGDWGEVTIRENEMRMIIKKSIDRNRKVSSVTLKIR